METKILRDLANETVRTYGDLATDFPQKMSKRIRRKFSINVEPDVIFEIAFHYKEIYNLAKDRLPSFLRSQGAKYADLTDVDFEGFVKALANNFPSDDFEILRLIGSAAIYYEYLR